MISVFGRLFLGSALCGCCMYVLPAQAQNIVTDVDWLAHHIDDDNVVILQVGRDETYRAGHIPGAVFASAHDVTRSVPFGDSEDGIVYELPESGALQEVLRSWGISNGSRIVVAPSDGYVTPASRMIFTLHQAGLGEQVSFLEGGLEAWQLAGHPLSTDPPDNIAGDITLPSGENFVVTTDWILDGEFARQGFVLVDARAPEFFTGEREARGSRGHIGGATNIFWESLFDEQEDGVVLLKDREALTDVFQNAGIGEGDTIVAYCHIGQQATAVILAARYLGYEVRLYDGSMNEWILRGLPVVEETTGR